MKLYGVVSYKGLLYKIGQTFKLEYFSLYACAEPFCYFVSVVRPLQAPPFLFLPCYLSGQVTYFLGCLSPREFSHTCSPSLLLSFIPPFPSLSSPTTLLTASSTAVPLSPVDTSSSSLSGKNTPPLSSSSSTTTTTSSSSDRRGAEGRGGGVRLLPPLLKDQAWGVQAQEAFLLFCLALGEWCLLL